MNPTRRGVLLAIGTATAGLAAACSSDDDTSSPTSTASSDASHEPASTSPSSSEAASAWRMPDEGAEHERTWMSFGISEDVWGEELFEPTKAALVRIADAIAEFEPVTALVEPGSEHPKVAQGVTFFESPTDDLWIRDTGPTFVTKTGDEGGEGGEIAGVDFNFNGWGNHQTHAKDAKVAAAVCTKAGVERITTKLCLEGGALEVDGEGTAIITESCVLNSNRNPGWTKERVEAELERTLGVTTVIWLPGIKGKDITDGHTDFYARFAGPGVVVAGREDDPKAYDYAVTRKHLDILKKAKDAKGRSLDVHVIPGPSDLRENYLNDQFAAGYINFYVCNGGVIMPEFGDADADAFAKETLEKLFDGRKVVQVNIDPIAAGGGGIHCATQQQPKETK